MAQSSASASDTNSSTVNEQLSALQSKLDKRDEELLVVRSENLSLRTTQHMLEAELRLAEHEAQQDSTVAQRALADARRSLTESRVFTGAVSTELRNEESTRQRLVANHTRDQVATRAEADVQRAAVTAELGLFELATRVQEDRDRQQVLAGARDDAERALVAAELGATERHLAVASVRAERAQRAADSAVAAGYHAERPNAPPPAAADATGARQRNDGLTPADAATGPSGSTAAAVEPPDIA